MKEGPAKFKPPRKTIRLEMRSLMGGSPVAPRQEAPTHLRCLLIAGDKTTKRHHLSISPPVAERLGYPVRTFDARPDRGHTARPFIPRL